jgi:hypothetical protein
MNNIAGSFPLQGSRRSVIPDSERSSQKNLVTLICETDSGLLYRHLLNMRRSYTPYPRSGRESTSPVPGNLVMVTIVDQPDSELIGEIENEDGIAEGVEEVRPDVLILAMDGCEKHRSQCGLLLGPEMRIVALTRGQNSAMFYGAIVDIRTKALENPEAGILNAIRMMPQMVGMWPI